MENCFTVAFNLFCLISFKYTVSDTLVFPAFIAYHLVEKACNSIKKGQTTNSILVAGSEVTVSRSSSRMSTSGTESHARAHLSTLAQRH